MVIENENENIKHNINILIDNLIRNLDISHFNNVDIVFEGGLFNGSYLIGALYYLKQLEDKKIIKIHRISGCSIGALISLIYYTNNYKLSDIIYKITYQHFKKKLNVNIFSKIFYTIRPLITSDVMKKINGNFYITYYNLKKNKQIVKNKYKNVDELFEMIRRSCHCPYVIDNTFSYKNKYVDGFYPFIFNDELALSNKILYFNIHNFDKITNSISIKNEKTNYSRILYGILDIHTFFITNYSTSMCSCVNNWGLIEKINNFVFIYILNSFIYLLHKAFLFNNVIQKIKKIDKHKYIENNENNNSIIKGFYFYFLKTYCV
jgi:hypothetical protein